MSGGEKESEQEHKQLIFFFTTKDISFLHNTCNRLERFTFSRAATTVKKCTNKTLRSAHLGVDVLGVCKAFYVYQG